MDVAIVIGIVALGVIVSFVSRKGVTRRPGYSQIPKIIPPKPSDRPPRIITKLSWRNPVTWIFIAGVIYIIYTVHSR